MIEEIRERFRQKQYEYSLHAVDQSILRRISTQEVEQAVQTSELVEEYPSDKYGPSCLLLGFTENGRPLHIQCTQAIRPIVKIITLYEPEAEKWLEFRKRR